MRLAAHPDLRSVANGTILIGGSPITVLRLSPAGAKLAKQWFAGDPVEAKAAHRQLAERLLERNMAAVVPTEQAKEHSVVVVIPVKDDPAGLAATLHRLIDVPIVIVDDGSKVAIEPSEDPHISVVRHERARGPAAARNAGLRHQVTRDADIVAFIDAGVEIDASDLMALAERLSAPDERRPAAVAPRIRSRPGARLIDRYERSASPLDLGLVSSRVRPGSPVSYVPTACFLISRRAIDEVGGFDAQLRFGEDVDLIWRLAADGQTIEYVATIEAAHPPRNSLTELVHQRMGYGSAAGPLGIRHGDAVAPWRANGWSAGITALAVSGWILPAVFVSAVSAERLRGQLPTQMPDRRAHAHRMAIIGHSQTIVGFARAAVRPWWPITLGALVLGPRRVRRVAAFLTIVGRIARLREAGRSPTQVSTLIALGLGAVDDASYGVGVWKGAVRGRTLRPLLPSLPFTNTEPFVNSEPKPSSQTGDA